jgi:hypothetical protein
VQKYIRSIAITFAVLIFFVMALVGWFSGLSPATCCSRSAIGAIITYIAVSWSARGVMSIMISEIIESKVNEANQKDKR